MSDQEECHRSKAQSPFHFANAVAAPVAGPKSGSTQSRSNNFQEILFTLLNTGTR